MAIKVEYIEEEKMEPISQYPVLMYYRKNDMIVLFTGPQSGVVMNDNDLYNAGYYSDNWGKCTNRDIWEKYSGKITLENR